MADGSQEKSEYVESLDGIDLVRVTSYGPQADEPDLVLLAQHGGDSRQLAEMFAPSVVDDTEVFDEFLRIDRDAGTPELVHAIAAEIREIRKDLKVLVVEVLYERALLDPNRIFGMGNRNVLKYEDAPEVNSLRGQIHACTINFIEAILRRLIVNKGLWMDIHSMAPYSPKHLHGEQPGHLRAYNYGYTSVENRGARRRLDVITEVSEIGSIANDVLLRRVEENLRLADILFERNNPYPNSSFPGKIVQGVWYLKENPGLAVDIPKDDLSIGVAEDTDWDLGRIEVDPVKLARLSKVFAPSLVGSVDEIRHQS